MQSESNNENSTSRSSNRIDFLAYLGTIFAGLIHGKLSEEQRNLNYKYLLTKFVKFPGLEDIFEDISNSYSKDGTLPTSTSLLTRFSKYESFMQPALSRFDESHNSLSHIEYQKIVDEYSVACLGRHTQHILAEAATMASEDPVNALEYVRVNSRNPGPNFVPISSFSMAETYDTDFNRARIFCPFLKPLDDCIGRFRLGHTAVLGAFRGHFKTTAAVNIFYNSVTKQEFHCCFLSLEMSKQEIYLRLLVLHAQDKKFGDKGYGVTLRKALQGKLTQEEKDFLFHEVEDDFRSLTLNKMEILESQDFPVLSMAEIQSRLLLVKSQLGGYLHAVFVDYIQMFARMGVTEAKFAKSIFEMTSIWARAFQQLAKNFNTEGIFVLLLAQTSNEAFKDAEKAGGVYQEGRVIGESKEIEDAADYVITLFCGEDEKRAATLKVQVTKNRFGDSMYTPGTLAIDPSRGVVQDWERGEDLDAYTIDLM